MKALKDRELKRLILRIERDLLAVSGLRSQLLSANITLRRHQKALRAVKKGGARPARRARKG